MSPVKIIESGYISGPITEDCVSPNGIDFRLDRLFAAHVVKDNHFTLFKDDTKRHLERTEYKPYYVDNKIKPFCGWVINGYTSYDFLTDYEVKLPHDIAAVILQRSTLNRNSMVISAGLFDSGFSGFIGAAITNNHKECAYIEHGSRIGQIVFMQAQSAKLYAGQYQNNVKHLGENIT